MEKMRYLEISYMQFKIKKIFVWTFVSFGTLKTKHFIKSLIFTVMDFQMT